MTKIQHWKQVFAGVLCLCVLGVAAYQSSVAVAGLKRSVEPGEVDREILQVVQNSQAYRSIAIRVAHGGLPIRVDRLDEHFVLLFSVWPDGFEQRASFRSDLAVFIVDGSDQSLVWAEVSDTDPSSGARLGVCLLTGQSRDLEAVRTSKTTVSSLTALMSGLLPLANYCEVCTEWVTVPAYTDEVCLVLCLGKCGQYDLHCQTHCYHRCHTPEYTYCANWEYYEPPCIEQ